MLIFYIILKSKRRILCVSDMIPNFKGTLSSIKNCIEKLVRLDAFYSTGNNCLFLFLRNVIGQTFN